MPLKEAVPFLKGAVARSLPGGAPSTYVFADGVMYAQNASILAAYPMPHILGTFGLAADDIEGAISRMPTEPIIEAGDGTLILRAGRLRSSIQLFAAEPPGHMLGDVNWEEPPDIIPAIEKVLPFVSTEGTWQRSIELVDGAVRAFSDAHTCAADVPGLAVSAPTALTEDSAAYLAKLPPSSGWKRLESALAFAWANGAWVRCQLLAQEWPNLIGNLFTQFSDPAMGTKIPITTEWREAFADIAALGEGTVDIGPDGMIGRSPHAEHRAEFATGAPETRWSLKPLSHVIEVAETWDADGRAAAFRGPGVRGVIAGMSR